LKTNELKDHKDVAHGAGKFRCDQCPNEYSSKRALQQHFKSKHLGVKLMQCPEEGCDFPGTNDHGKMRAHMLNAHGEGLKCDKCNKVFQNFRSMKRHNCEKMKSFSCPECKRELISAANLQKHIATYHSGKPQFVCHLCGKILGTQATLGKHLQREHQPDSDSD
jgi:uncharacterized Zn-finger protein